MVKNNRRALAKLEKEIVAEYWQGYNLPRLQERAEEKMEKRGIVAPRPAAIAELTVYKDITGRPAKTEYPQPPLPSATTQAVIV